MHQVREILKYSADACTFRTRRPLQGSTENDPLLQDIAYSYRVWITLIKLLYAPLQHPKTNPEQDSRGGALPTR